MTRATPQQQARKWWKQRVDAHQYVVPAAALPSAPILRLLRDERLVLDVANGRAAIVTEPTRANDRAVVLANYWSIVALVLGGYAPAVITGVDAVRVHLGDWSIPITLFAIQAANRSNYTLPLYADLAVRLKPAPLTAEAIAWLTGPGDNRVPALAPADLLLELDLTELQAGLEPVSAWLRHLVLPTPDLYRAVDRTPRTHVIERLAGLAHQLGNTSLAVQLEAALRRISTRRRGPSTTGIGTVFVAPPILAGTRPTGEPAWVDEQRLRLARQGDEVASIVAPGLGALSRMPLQRLLAHARRVKAYDAYHNTTMEGYRISREVAEAIVNGEPMPNGPQSLEQLQAIMAVQGYTRAFDTVLKLGRTSEPVTVALLLDLYEDLFRPSVDAGLVAPGELRAFRTGGVGLNGWRHIPPNAKKLRDLLRGFEQFTGDTTVDPVTRAIVAHLEFVTIHPFVDGNGRLGRLLFNLQLLRTGLPWVTVRNDEKMPFFQAIEAAQVDSHTEQYARFMWHAIAEAHRDLLAAAQRARRGARNVSR